MYEYRARLKRIIDGDSCVLIVSLGFYIEIEMHFRLLGINTPELNSKDINIRNKANLAKTRLEELLKDKELIIKTEKDKTEKYGRMLATIFVNDLNINNQLINEGLAEKYLG